MGRLRALSGAEVVKVFEGFGFRAAGQRGSHLKLKREGQDGRGQVLIVPKHAELDKGTLRGIFVQGCRFLEEGALRSHFYSE